MSDCENSEFDERLQELNNWQIEQHRKLKLFQEAQRKLLDSEHEKVLSSLKTQSYEHRHETSVKDALLAAMLEVEDKSETQSKTPNPNYLFNYKSDAVKLNYPKIDLCSISQYSQSEKSDELFDYNNHEETETNRPRKFLRRGEGLARFRMTIDDFKTPPKIYKEKKIKTYLKEKPGFSRNKLQTRTFKSVNEGFKRKPSGVCTKSKPVPVNIYVSENKKISAPEKNTSDVQVNKIPYCPKRKELPLTKAPVRTLTLKPVLPSNFTRSVPDRSNGNNDKSTEKLTDKSTEKNTMEKEMKKDEKELKMFEMLEGKIDDGSLSPNSSLVARFMEESLCSTPSKPVNGECENEIAYSYLESLRALQRQYLTPEQMERIKVSDEELSSNYNPKNDDKTSESPGSSLAGSVMIDEEKIGQNDKGESDEVEFPGISEESGKEYCKESPRDVTPLLPEASKTLLQEYIQNFKKLKNEVEECQQSDNEEDINGDRDCLDDINDHMLSQREIAIKLQRKALQDNVKTLLNWEGPTRKKQPKKIARKAKSKPVKPEKTRKLDKADKIVVNNGLLKDRMVELEKEIEIFKRENRTLIQMQRECEKEKMRLEKERKEFEKFMAQEKEKFDSRMMEEQKKLQRDKNVFEKYCKQVRNQPNKKEREEITNLKKELEKLTETMMTKDARWGASQARLRNQIKSLEKDNAELKSEIEKFKKQNSKKVTFESGKNLNTKIIHAINSELGKLKPHLMKPGSTKQKYQSQTARVDSNLQQKPMRRIRSVPDLKKHSAKEDDIEEKTSPDNKMAYIAKELSVSRSSPGSSSDLEKTDKAMDSEECNCDDNRKKPVKEDMTETVLREAFFEGDRGDHNKTITEIKKRLEKLSMLQHSGPWNGDGDENGTVSSESSSEESVESEEDSESEKKAVVELGENRSKCLRGSPTIPIYHCQTKDVREKTYEDGRKEIFYPNGNIKKISGDKRIVKMLYYNGDLKETDVTDGSEKYYYAETKTWHTTYRDGLEVLEFPNGQTERRHPDGSTEILFPNGCVRYCDSSGKDEWRFLDGTVIKTDKNGHKVLLLPNGQKEIHTDEYKRREYPDGTVKLLYADGTQETRYATGRVRLKDKDGNLVMDSGGIR